MCAANGGTWSPAGSVNGSCTYPSLTPEQQCLADGGIWGYGSCFLDHVVCAANGGTWSPAGSVNGSCTYPSLTPEQQCLADGGIWGYGSCFLDHVVCAANGGTWSPAGSVNGSCTYPSLTPEQQCLADGGIWGYGSCFLDHVVCAANGGTWSPAGSVNGSCTYPSLTPEQQCLADGGIWGFGSCFLDHVVCAANGGTWSPAGSVNGSCECPVGEHMDGSCQTDHVTPPACTANGTETFPVHDATEEDGHRDVTPPQCTQSVVISNFVANPGMLTGTFDVVPSTADCSVSGPVTVSRSVALTPQVTVSASGASRDVEVVPSSHTEPVTATVNCSQVEYLSVTATVVLTPPVRISDFDGATIVGAGEISDDFRVTPKGAECTARNVRGLPAIPGFLPNANAGEHTVFVRTSTTGSVTVEVTCTHMGESTFQRAAFVAEPPPPVDPLEVAITGFGGVSGPSPLTAAFTVTPVTAQCVPYTSPRRADVSLRWTDRQGDSRAFSVTTATAGPVGLAVVCYLGGHTLGHASAEFVVTPTVDCVRPLVLEANPDFTLEPEFVFYDGWLPVPSTDSCLSTQLGNAQTPHYANRFSFTTRADVRITVFADPDTSRDPRLKLTVIKHSSGGPPPVQMNPTNTVITAVSDDTYELTPGRYTIEVTTVDPLDTGHFTLSAAALGETGFDTVKATSVPSGQKVYPVAAGALDGIMKAAQNALDTDVHNCAANVPARYRLTRNRLVALLIAISHNELLGDGPHALMNVGRSDWVAGQLTTSDHLPLYSFNTAVGNVRAFWHGGVGLWQIDDANGSGLNHAERAHAWTGAATAADIFLKIYCKAVGRETPIQQLKDSFEPWHDCDSDVEDGIECYNTFEDIVVGDAFPSTRVSSDVRLYLRVHDEYSDRAGGVRPRKCKWTTEVEAFDCFLYDTEHAQGRWWGGSLDGNTAIGIEGGISPVACPFISFTQEWPGSISSEPVRNSNALGHAGREYKFVVFKDVDQECVFSGGSVPSGSDIIAAVPKGHDLRTIERVGLTRTDKWWYVDTVGGVGVEVCDDCELTDDDDDDE